MTYTAEELAQHMENDCMLVGWDDVPAMLRSQATEIARLRETLNKECDDGDELLRMLDLDPETYRTEGGRLNLLKIRAALAERKSEVNVGLTAMLGGNQPTERTMKIEVEVTEDQINKMVNRFLRWKLPQDFAPDAGISFKPMPDIYMPHCWPTGTNLLHAGQAKALIEYLLGDDAEDMGHFPAGKCVMHEGA